MRVLISCESSGTVREAFRKLGHDAWSCDILPADDNSPYHYTGDCINVIKQGWHLIIGHPPCTALAVSGNSTYAYGMPKHQKRLDSIKWTEDLWQLMCANASYVCMENPVGVLSTQSNIKTKPQYIQPYQFGHAESKKTGLWLHNLPKLKDSNNVKNEFDSLPKAQQQRLHYLPPSPDRWKIRSKTYQGIADAMADQWGGLNNG